MLVTFCQHRLIQSDDTLPPCLMIALLGYGILIHCSRYCSQLLASMLQDDYVAITNCCYHWFHLLTIFQVILGQLFLRHVFFHLFQKTTSGDYSAPCGPGAIPLSPYSFTFPPSALSFNILLFPFSLSYSLHLFSCFSIPSHSTRIVQLTVFRLNEIGGD